MQESNKEKTVSLLSRSFNSLPCVNDLPRLLKQIQVFEGDTLIVDPRQKGGDESLVDLFYTLISSLAHYLGEEEQNLITTTFNIFKKKLGESNSLPKGKDIDKEALDQVVDPKLRNALRYLKTAFIGTEDTIKTLFQIDKPSAYITLEISPKGIKIRNRDSLKKEKVDCKLSCSSAVLTSILDGSLEPLVALQRESIIVDNLKKFSTVAKAFRLDKATFDDWNMGTRSRRNSITPSAEEHVIFTHNLKKYFSEVLGEQSRLTKILKACNSAIISPAVIDLKFSLGVNYMTKDVPAGNLPLYL